MSRLRNKRYREVLVAFDVDDTTCIIPSKLILTEGALVNGDSVSVRFEGKILQATVIHQSGKIFSPSYFSLFS